MKLIDFDYHLPEELIAQTPAEPRDSARLLHFNTSENTIQDTVFSDIVDMLSDNDVLVVNETRVIKARLKWKISWTDKDCEIFLHTQVSESSWDCLVYPGKKLKPWAQVIFENSDLTWKIIKNSKKWRIVEFSLSGSTFLDAIDVIGETPLPPYIKEHSGHDERYQTVYSDSDKSWSVAAPTAGLHFTPELIDKLLTKWVKIEKVCLHVGLGTFLNVEVENIEDHDMHSEQIYIAPETAQRLNGHKKQGKRIIAVGTTSVRTLESMSDNTSHLWHGQKDTDIFIFPGYQWQFVDSIITNFHLPKSTLLMLVSSFIWDQNRKRVYQHAVDSHYRFFSFWDAMFLE